MESTEIQAKAAEWLVEMKTTPKVEALWPEFYAWMNAAPEHREAYLKLEDAWRIGHRELIAAKRFGQGATGQFFEEVNAVSARRQAAHRYRLLAGCVLLLGVVGLSLVISRHPPGDSYETVYGEQRPIKLSDGSIIELNTNTKVLVRMTPHEREIALDRGEALFTVAADRERPFKVSVDNDILVATGTEFAVRVEPDGVADAYVQQGTVDVYARKKHSIIGGTEKTLQLRPGDVATLSAAGAQVVEAGLSTVKQKLAWRAGNIDIDGSLAHAVNEFNRYNTRHLEIDDAAIADKHVQGVFKATDPDEFAREVSRRFGIPVSFPTSADTKEGVIRLGGNG